MYLTFQYCIQFCSLQILFNVVELAITFIMVRRTTVLTNKMLFPITYLLVDYLFLLYIGVPLFKVPNMSVITLVQ